MTFQGAVSNEYYVVGSLATQRIERKVMLSKVATPTKWYAVCKVKTQSEFNFV